MQHAACSSSLVMETGQVRWLVWARGKKEGQYHSRSKADRPCAASSRGASPLGLPGGSGGLFLLGLLHCFGAVLVWFGGRLETWSNRGATLAAGGG